ncbi:unnamed protein product [Clonostachys rosea f. rosea IK726]|uniref:Uncharacterized protein n=2 Tax=Bionectria ochroleuca TaxID=29856 RepID=A0A0B7JPD1_BIOOC|nr:unnamed protein product [Clonostachys rosea f. rosea IK726]
MEDAEPQTLPGFEKEITENVVEYLIFCIESNSDARNTLSRLETVRKAAIQNCQSLTKDYLWQREEFNLELKNEGGLIYLRGATDYGDAVEDEWLIVHLLRELTRSHPNIWVRVFDSDGEFLLVEAANVLPKWLSPEIDHNRVWIHDGKLFIIPFREHSPEMPRALSLPLALDFIKTKKDQLVHSEFIESEAFYRLEKYPAQISQSLHHSLVTIPRKLAYIIHKIPKSVPPAVEAFYTRDALALKPILSPSHAFVFPPEDFVTVSVKFSKVLFAQLRSQRFEPPPKWQTPLQAQRKQDNTTEQDHYALDNGTKLTCGFEILAAKAAQHPSRVVRELALELEDLEEDGDEVLPSDDDIRGWPAYDRADSEAWLDINYEDFENELSGKRKGQAKGSSEGFGDADAQANLRKIVSRFEAFLNDDQAGVDGVEVDEMDEDDDDDLDSEEDSDAEDKEVSFDEEEFAKMMREMMGLPSPDIPTQSGTEAGKATKKASFVESDHEDEEIRQLASEMEAELSKHGVLKLDPPKEKRARIQDKGKSPQDDTRGAGSTNAEEDSDEEIQVDYNLAKNILESFKSQGGMSGPTSNLLGMMGVQLPRDEDDEADQANHKAGSSSQGKR